MNQHEIIDLVQQGRDEEGRPIFGPGKPDKSRKGAVFAIGALIAAAATTLILTRGSGDKCPVSAGADQKCGGATATENDGGLAAKEAERVDQHLQGQIDSITEMGRRTAAEQVKVDDDQRTPEMITRAEKEQRLKVGLITALSEEKKFENVKVEIMGPNSFDITFSEGGNFYQAWIYTSPIAGGSNSTEFRKTKLDRNGNERFPKWILKDGKTNGGTSGIFYKDSQSPSVEMSQAEADAMFDRFLAKFAAKLKIKI
ncbi:MAG: hypothetical protein WCT53_03270 [Candidatus Gracilibacteria bacterium]